jgi:hypothetical protein
MAKPKRLTDSDVRWLRRFGAKYGYAYCGRVVGCSRQHVMDICTGRRRASVPDYS